MVRKSTNWVVQRRPELGVSLRLRGVVQLMLTATAMLVGQQKGARGGLRAGILVHIGSYPAGVRGSRCGSRLLSSQMARSERWRC
jgi:hypothetical protein